MKFLVVDEHFNNGAMFSPFIPRVGDVIDLTNIREIRNDFHRPIDKDYRRTVKRVVACPSKGYLEKKYRLRDEELNDICAIVNIERL